MDVQFSNPFRPGAGHMPPHLAGRTKETEEFVKLLQQKIILENFILTGLRGIGKTVLLETFMPIAVKKGWLWTGSILSESASVSEKNLVMRILTDISVVTAGITYAEEVVDGIGFKSEEAVVEKKMDLEFLFNLYLSCPGLTSDKLKYVLEFVWDNLKQKENISGMIFAYDEAQSMSDHAEKDEYPLSILLDVFQSIQKKEIPFMLVLVGLPTLFPKLVEARTYSERMFRVVTLGKLSEKDSIEAIRKPIERSDCSVKFTEKSIETIAKASGGYPYFIQFICREVYDILFQRISSKEELNVPLNEILAKLDTDFFSGRWMRATDRQRELLRAIAELPNSNEEFTVAEIVDMAKEKMAKPMGPSQISQTLAALIPAGLIFKNRYGKYSYAVPLLGEFIRRQNVPGCILDNPL